GLAMSARLTAGVGIRRAARIARRITRETATATAGGGGTSRRAMLRATGTGALALLGLTLGTGTALARADDPGLLTGAAYKKAIDTAAAAGEVKAAVAGLPKSGFNGTVKRALAFTTETASTIVILFFAPENKAEAKSKAAVLTHEYGGASDNSKTVVEFVTADLDAIKKRDRFERDDFKVVRAGGAAPRGAGEYFSCMLACIGMQCAGPATRCRGLIFLWAVLACMVAVCGSKARSCHAGCKRLW
ncbi:hypothetical protein SAMN05421505_1962, partial [Sinosporangium album]